MPELQSVTQVGGTKNVSPSCVVRTRGFLRCVVLGQSPNFGDVGGGGPFSPWGQTCWRRLHK